jgi:hypothetical protein
MVPSPFSDRNFRHTIIWRAPYFNMQGDTILNSHNEETGPIIPWKKGPGD